MQFLSPCRKQTKLMPYEGNTYTYLYSQSGFARKSITLTLMVFDYVAWSSLTASVICLIQYKFFEWTQLNEFYRVQSPNIWLPASGSFEPVVAHFVHIQCSSEITVQKFACKTCVHNLDICIRLRLCVHAFLMHLISMYEVAYCLLIVLILNACC